MKHLICSLALVAALGAYGGAQDGGATLYNCAAEPPDETVALGLTLCDASPTDVLVSQADTDNLQQREGALVLDLDTDGITEAAGFAPGDVIYRVGGVDVADARSAAERLEQVEARADTLVNFLRAGRPYRIKLRRE